MRGVQRLEDARARLVGDDAQPLRRLLRLRRLVAQRLQQPGDAVHAFRRAEEHRDDQVLLQVAGEAGVDLVRIGDDVFQQLLQQHIVEVGDRLQHAGARLLLLGRQPSPAPGSARSACLSAQRKARSLTRSTKPLIFSPSRMGISRSTSGRIDSPCSASSVARILPPARSILLTNTRCGMPRSSRNRSSGASVNTFCGSGSQTTTARSTTDQRVEGILRQLDEAGAIEEGPGLAQIFGGGDVEFGRHLPGARFGAAVADGVALAHAALAGNQRRSATARSPAATFCRRDRGRRKRRSGGPTAVCVSRHISRGFVLGRAGLVAWSYPREG